MACPNQLKRIPGEAHQLWRVRWLYSFPECYRWDTGEASRKKVDTTVRFPNDLITSFMLSQWTIVNKMSSILATLELSCCTVSSRACMKGYFPFRIKQCLSEMNGIIPSLNFIQKCWISFYSTVNRKSIVVEKDLKDFLNSCSDINIHAGMYVCMYVSFHCI